MTDTSANNVVFNALKPLVKGAVWPFVRPAGHNNLPYIIYSPVTENPLSTLEGRTGDNQIRMQIDAYADTLDEASKLKNDLIPIIESLESVSATVQDGGSSGHERDTNLFRSTVEFLIWEKV